MLFEIDVSGEDILAGNYVVVVANVGNLIYAYRFDKKIVNEVKSKFYQRKYRYDLSHKGRVFFKIRLYSIALFYLFREICKHHRNLGSIELYICRDFSGHENTIKTNLEYFLENLLLLDIKRYLFVRLGIDSNAHKYAYLVRKKKTKENVYFVNISIKKFERFL